jgi:predicted transcriptional regulator of viral defense system
MSNARNVLENLASQGRYHFTLEEISRLSDSTPAAAKLAVLRLAKQGLVASPARGFYIIIPPEYRRLKSLPADQFIPALMEREKRSYYVSLLSAAQYHGAAHHRPQELQVMIAKNRRSIKSGAVRVAFIARARIKDVPTQNFNTPRGPIRVSTVEATALDLVGYARHVGGLDHVATVIQELAENIDPKRLASVARTAPMPWAQRLGYILETVDAADKALVLKEFIRKKARDMTPLLPSKSVGRARRNKDWHLYVNARVEAEA